MKGRRRTPGKALIGLTALLMFVIVARIADVLPFLQGLPIVKVLTAIAFLALLMTPAVARPSLQTSAIARYTYAIVVLAALSLAYSYWRGMSFAVLTGSIAAIVVLMLLVFKSAFRIDTFETYLKTLAWAGVALTIGGVVHAADGRLAFGTTYDPNDLAFVMATLIPIMLAFWRLSNGWRALAWALAAAAAGGVALLTQSRGGLLGLLLALSYLGAVGAWRSRFEKKLRVGRVLAGWTLLAVVGTGAFLLLPADARERYATLLNPAADYNVTAQREGRLALWQRGLEALGETPWGVGVGAYRMAEMEKSGYWRTAHNSLLEISVELGVVGGVLFVLLWWRAWRVLGHLMDRAVPSGATSRRPRSRAPPSAGVEAVEDPSVEALDDRPSAELDDRPASTRPESPREVRVDPATAPVPEHWAIHAQHLRASIAGLLGAGFFISQAYSLVAFSLLAIVAGLESRYAPRGVAVPAALGTRLRGRRRSGYTPA